MADDELTAELDHIRAGIEIASDLPMTADPRRVVTIYAPRLVAALDAVLKQHQPGRITLFGALCKRHESYRHFSITSTEAAGVRACQDCTATVYNSCTGCGPQVNVDLCPTRNAITRALTGEEKADD